MDFTGGKIIVRIVAPTSYNVPNDVDIIEVDTSSGGLTTINLQKITIGDARKSVYISDVSDNKWGWNYLWKRWLCTKKLLFAWP